MSVATRLGLLAAMVSVLAGCNMRQPGDPPPIPPGLEPLYRTAPLPSVLPPPPSGPQRWNVDEQPFFAAALNGPLAEQALAGDPIALRFLALKDIGDRGQIDPQDAAIRRNNNLGALLPLTYVLPPAAGLDAPIPSLSDLAALLKRLESSGTPAERQFFLDKILPANPTSRQPLAPPDIDSANRLKSRLDRLEQTGLISPEERAKENQALNALITSGALPQTYQAPQPPPPPPKKKPGSGNGGARMPGGVSGKLEVIPSPPGVAAPKLTDKDKGPVGVHLLSMGSASHGDNAWTALKTEHPELATLSFKVAKADLGDLGVTYRLIAGPLEREAAEKLCTTLKGRNQTCAPTPFPQ